MISLDEISFHELRPTVLHDIYALRSEVFVVEQNCIYQDIDGKDKEAIHIVGRLKENIVAYARILCHQRSNTNFVSIGRIVILEKERGKGYGHKLVEFCISVINKNWPAKKIKISAQAHLKKFYESHGFIKRGVEYLEDGIPHIEMIKKRKY